MAVPPADPTVRRLRAQVAASTRWAVEDPSSPETAAKLARARSAFEARFYRDIPDDVPEAERERRAASARKAYFAGLALKSVMKRKRTAAARKTGGDDDEAA